MHANRFVVLLLAAAAAMLALQVSAQTYPDKPIRLVGESNRESAMSRSRSRLADFNRDGPSTNSGV